MNKYDEILNELVYEIDDVVYEFYSKSNQVISKKRNQDRLLDFRDKSLNTINEMNVRSLEIIASFKDKTLVEERCASLLTKNHNLVNSVLEILDESPSKHEFVEDVVKMASNVYDSTKDLLNKVDANAKFEKAKEMAQAGIAKASESLDELNKDERVIKSKAIIKEKANEASEYGSKILKDGSNKLADWVHDLKEDVKDVDVAEKTEDFEEKLEKMSDEFHYFKSDIENKVEDKEEDIIEGVKDKKEDLLNLFDKVDDKVEDKKDDLQDFLSDLGEKIEDKQDEAVEALDDVEDKLDK